MNGINVANALNTLKFNLKTQLKKMTAKLFNAHSPNLIKTPRKAHVNYVLINLDAQEQQIVWDKKLLNLT